MYIIEKELYKPIPDWVDSKMIPNIKKKRESPFYLKFLSILANIYLHGPTFISWNTLEKQLDIIIEKIKQNNKNMDIVVGIKTGGAIISDYISKKLNIPDYKIKLSRSEYNCAKKPIDTLNDIYQRNIVGNLGEYSVCEGITEDIQGKNVILIDEMITTGKTMNEAIQYLKTEKHANFVYPVCISFSKNRFLYDFNCIYTIKNTVLVRPRGYDN
jgi:hypoxanthine phosphoribosyltransferase